MQLPLGTRILITRRRPLRFRFEGKFGLFLLLGLLLPLSFIHVRAYRLRFRFRYCFLSMSLISVIHLLFLTYI